MENRILGIVFHNLASKKTLKINYKNIGSTHYRDYTVLVSSNDISAPTVIENLECSAAFEEHGILKPQLTDIQFGYPENLPEISSNFYEHFLKNLVKILIKFYFRITQILVIIYPKFPENFLFCGTSTNFR